MNPDHARLCSSQEWAVHVRKELIPEVVGALRLGDDVLEIGPGYGPTTAVLRELTPHLTALELDEHLAAALRARFDDVVVVRGDGACLPFDKARFSAVVCFTMLHHVASDEQQDRILTEAHRVLRPGGVFAGSDSIANEDLRQFHHDDVYTPIDPAHLCERLTRAGFASPQVTVPPGEGHFTFTAYR